MRQLDRSVPTPFPDPVPDHVDPVRSVLPRSINEEEPLSVRVEVVGAATHVQIWPFHDEPGCARFVVASLLLVGLLEPLQQVEDVRTVGSGFIGLHADDEVFGLEGFEILDLATEDDQVVHGHVVFIDV